MSGGAGFSRDAMKRTQENRNALKTVRRKYFKARKLYNEVSRKFDLGESDSKVVLEIRKQMREERKKREIFAWLVFAIILVVILTFTWLLNN